MCPPFSLNPHQAFISVRWNCSSRTDTIRCPPHAESNGPSSAFLSPDLAEHWTDCSVPPCGGWFFPWRPGHSALLVFLHDTDRLTLSCWFFSFLFSLTTPCWVAPGSVFNSFFFSDSVHFLDDLSLTDQPYSNDRHIPLPVGLFSLTLATCFHHPLDISSLPPAPHCSPQELSHPSWQRPYSCSVPNSTVILHSFFSVTSQSNLYLLCFYPELFPRTGPPSLLPTLVQATIVFELDRFCSFPNMSLWFYPCSHKAFFTTATSVILLQNKLDHVFPSLLKSMR